MNKTELQKRFNFLDNVLFQSRNLGYFNSSQRTCLHMERAAILRALNHIELGKTELASPSYTIPNHLEFKCKQVLKDFNETTTLKNEQK